MDSLALRDLGIIPCAGRARGKPAQRSGMPRTTTRMALIMALAAYLSFGALLLWLVQRTLLRLSAPACLALLCLPLAFTGRAAFTGRIYAPVDLSFQTLPLRSLEARYGVSGERR